MDNITKDGVTVTAAQEVYGISPWGDIEVLYVDLNQTSATTEYPHEGSGANWCCFPIVECFASKDLAISTMCTYIEDEEGFMHPPETN